MAASLENDGKSAGKDKDAVKTGSDTTAGQEAKPEAMSEVKAVQEMTPADWQAANRQAADKQVAGDPGVGNQGFGKQVADATASDQPASLPKVSLETPAPLAPKEILINPAASAEDKLKAVEALGRAGQTSVEVVDKDGTKRNLTIELEKAGKRTLVHLYANDDQGKEHVVLRGVKNADGSWQQQQTERGDAVSSYGTWWANNMGDRTFFSDAVKLETKVAEQKVASEDLFSEKRNLIPAAPDVKPAAQVYDQPKLEPYVQPYVAPPQLDAQAIPRVIPTQREISVQDLPVPQREVVVPWNKPEQRVVTDEERLNQLFDGVAKSAGYARRLTRVDGGSVYFRAGMAIDADGSPRARQIDPDGQSNTSLRHRNGAPVNAETTKYFVLPLERYQQYGVRLGDIAAVRYGDNVRFAVFADVGPHQKLGEGSMALAASLGINSNPRHGGTHRPEVEYIVFPGSGNGRPLHSNAHEGLGRHYLGKAYRNTKRT